MHAQPTWFDHRFMVRKDVRHFHEVLRMHQIPDVVTNDIDLPEGGGAGAGEGEQGGREKCRVMLIRTYLLSCTCMSVLTVASPLTLRLSPHPSPSHYPLTPHPHTIPTPLTLTLLPHPSPSHYCLTLHPHTIASPLTTHTITSPLTTNTITSPHPPSPV